MKEPFTFKASPINPAWTEEVASSFGLAGHLGKEVATELAAQITATIAKKFTRPKLAKLVRAAFHKSAR